MDQEKIYGEARDILKTIADVPIGNLRIDEALFLFRHCLRKGDGFITVTVEFGEKELQTLLGIAQAIVTRGNQTIH